MPVAFGINGFGRIGRLVMRAALDNPGTSRKSNEYRTKDAKKNLDLAN